MNKDKKEVDRSSYPGVTPCNNCQPEIKGKLGGPKHVCKMEKGHPGECFQVFTIAVRC